MGAFSSSGAFISAHVWRVHRSGESGSGSMVGICDDERAPPEERKEEIEKESCDMKRVGSLWEGCID